MKPKKITVLWEDSYGPLDTYWTFLSEWINKPVQVYTRGYLIKNHKNYIIVPSSIPDRKGFAPGGNILIPRSAILKIKTK